MFVLCSIGERRKAVPCAVILLAAWLVGCQAPPPDETVRDVISGYFESRGYHVQELDVGGIRSIPAGEKRYMGVPAFDIQVNTITLEGATRGLLSFNDSRVRIREAPGSPRGWVVTSVTGIPLP